MRRRMLGVVLGVCLAAVATPVAAQDGADLGLDAISVTSVSFSRDGSAIVRGRITCSQTVDGAAFLSVYQGVGRIATIAADAFVEFRCRASAGSLSFAIPVFPFAGKFRGGRAVVMAQAETFVCDPDSGECFDDVVTYGPATVRLRH